MKPRRALPWAGATTLAMVAACGSGDPGAAVPVAPPIATVDVPHPGATPSARRARAARTGLPGGRAAELLLAYCDREERCYPDRSRERCLARYPKYEALVARHDPAATEAWTKCMRRHPCGKSADWCIAEAFEAMETPQRAALRERCLAKRAQCSKAFADDYCFSTVMLSDGAHRDAARCIDGACDGVRDCLKGAGAFSY